MRIDIHHIHHPDAETEERLARIEAGIIRLLNMGYQEMKEFDDLVAEVAAVHDVEQAAVTAIHGLHDQIDALGSAPTPEQISALKDNLKATADDLAAAIATPPPPLVPQTAAEQAPVPEDPSIA